MNTVTHSRVLSS